MTALRNPHVLYALVTAPGFGNTEFTDTGMQKLNLELTARYHDRRESLVLHRAWNSNARDAAWLLHMKCRPDALVAVVAHSYGGGVFFPRLARELDWLNRRISVCYLIDPVPRFPTHTMWPWNLWRHARGQDRIKLPGNVDQAHVYWQVNDYPRGRDLKNGSERIVERRVYGKRERLDRLAAHTSPSQRTLWDGASHSRIDDNANIQEAILADIELRVNALR